MASIRPFIPDDDFRRRQNKSLLSPLSDWVQDRIIEIYLAIGASKNIDGTIAKFVTGDEEQNIAVNGSRISLDQLKEEFGREGGVGDREEVLFTEVNVASDEEEDEEPFLSGNIDVTYRVKDRVVSLNLVVFQDETLIPPRIPLSGFPGFIDRRRVSKLVWQG